MRVDDGLFRRASQSEAGVAALLASTQRFGHSVVLHLQRARFLVAPQPIPPRLNRRR